ncbi:MAG TPA: hypothetical protein ENL21_09695 [Caldithrix abyssi]|uniref:Uncharacterized protein n=1 Tax=Caldithrix abyssi TaxID=187145 RepID=A0A7V5H550_CALAY|nr:hypothetical protein [Caldisericaceae bacterium]HHE56044.1 hypothetical protein [Caldithrix abyssi]
MKFKFDEKKLAEIEKVLETKFARRGNQYRAVLLNTEEQRKLSIEIYPEIQIGNRTGNLISIYTNNTHAQLHFCEGFVASDFLGEVTFFAEYNGRLSGIVVEKQAACSIFTNIDRDLLSGDFEKLAPEVMLSGLALSLAEPLLEENKKDKQDD